MFCTQITSRQSHQGGCDGRDMWQAWRTSDMYAGFWWGNLKQRHNRNTSASSATCHYCFKLHVLSATLRFQSLYKKTQPLISPFRHDSLRFTNHVLAKVITTKQTAPGRCRMEGKFSSNIGFYTADILLLSLFLGKDWCEYQPAWRGAGCM
jgi:hypothetical protein